MKSNRPTGLFLVSIVIAASFIGCPLLKKKSSDAGTDDLASLLDAATVGAAGLGAKNEASVLRYANETPLNNEPAVIGSDGAKVRNFPGNGPEVATLSKGTAVAKIAQYFQTGTLVMFDDPSGDGSKLMGWVSPKVFDVAAPPPAKTVVVPTPTPVVRVDAGVAVKDAGAPQDAGGAKVAVVDAGGGGGGNFTPPEPPKGAVAVPPTAGKCPTGWTIADSMCRRKCATDPDCPRGTKCLMKQGQKVCSSG